MNLAKKLREERILLRLPPLFDELLGICLTTPPHSPIIFPPAGRVNRVR